MYEEGGGQITCYWYVLISLKLFLIVCIWEEIIHCTVPTIRYISNTKLRCYQTLNSVNFVSNHYEKFTDRFAGMTWNCHIGYMIFYAYLGKNFYFAQCLGICGISWNQGVCLKGHFGEKTSLNPSQFLVLLKMVWHVHKDDGDKDFQSSLLSNIQFWQFYNPIPNLIP